MNRTTRRSTNSGEINVLLVPFVLLLIFFLGTAAFAFWAYSSREDYRVHAEAKIDAAVKVAKDQESDAKDKEFAETSKLPLIVWGGAEQLGSIKVSYPRTWSGYIADAGNNSQSIDAYFHLGVVPSVNDQTTAYALRVKVVNQSYANVAQPYTALVTAKKLTAAPYAFPHVASVVGVRYDGAILSGKKITGSMVMVPLRDKTLEVWTESPQYQADFNNNILPNLTFSP